MFSGYFMSDIMFTLLSSTTFKYSNNLRFSVGRLLSPKKMRILLFSGSIFFFWNVCNFKFQELDRIALLFWNFHIHFLVLFYLCLPRFMAAIGLVLFILECFFRYRLFRFLVKSFWLLPRLKSRSILTMNPILKYFFTRYSY